LIICSKYILFQLGKAIKPLLKKTLIKIIFTPNHASFLYDKTKK